MTRKIWLVAALGLLTASCGRSAVSGFYKGTLAETFTSGGNTSTYTTTGASLWIHDAAEANKVVMYFEVDDPGIVGTVSGTTINVNPNQVGNYTSGNFQRTQTITSGSATVTDKSISMSYSYTRTTTSGGNTTTTTYNATFTGMRE